MSEVRGAVDVWVSGEQLTEGEPAHLDEAEERLGAEHTMVLVRVAHVPVGGYKTIFGWLLEVADVACYFRWRERSGHGTMSGGGGGWKLIQV